MKITEMLVREDFYTINKKTLDSYFCNKNAETKLYIYPLFSAIVTKRPGKKVVEYLKTEFSLASKNIIKKLLVKISLILSMRTLGLLSSRRVTVSSCIKNNVLIYPCNKKYRIFDFDTGIVTVVLKDGFSNRSIKNEIMFRTKPNLPSFIPELIESFENGYSERIIDGKPLARLNAFEYKEQAYSLFSSTLLTSINKNASDYLAFLAKEIMIMPLTSQLIKEKSFSIASIAERYSKHVKGEVVIGFSHGDLQPGNIWIENKTNKIYIIDWESCGIRSNYYDKAVLFDKLRPGPIDNYIHKNINTFEKTIVLLEDVVFRLNESNEVLTNNSSIIFEYLSKVESFLRNLQNEE